MVEAFASIYERAAARKGGPDALEELLPQPTPEAVLRETSDARMLSAASKHVFSAGFQWRVVEAKWPGFEEALYGFDPPRVAMMTDLEIEALTQDRRVIRHRGKLVATRDNARLVVDVGEEHGSFAGFVAAWPDDDVVGLWEFLKKNGSRLGGNTGPYFLRGRGKDTFLLTKDVVRALIAAGVVDKAPTGKGAKRAVQAAFNGWKAESGRSFAAISRTLACSVPD